MARCGHSNKLAAVQRHQASSHGAVDRLPASRV